jgi:hypothetical protein
MQKLTLVLLAATLGAARITIGATYSTEATMSLQKDEGTYLVEVKISELTEKNGKVTERLISRPRLLSSPGVPATLHQGTSPNDPDYAKEENVTVDVSWPYPNESGTAFCSVTVKRGDSIVSKSRMQLKIDGPGRTPLVLAVPDVDPKSVKVSELNADYYVLLEFANKSKQEVKKLAVENYGNKVQLRDHQGHLIDAGLSFGTYQQVGLTLQCKNEADANRIASIFRGESLR